MRSTWKEEKSSRQTDVNVQRQKDLLMKLMFKQLSIHILYNEIQTKLIKEKGQNIIG